MLQYLTLLPHTSPPSVRSRQQRIAFGDTESRETHDLKFVFTGRRTGALLRSMLWIRDNNRGQMIENKNKGCRKQAETRQGQNLLSLDTYGGLGNNRGNGKSPAGARRDTMDEAARWFKRWLSFIALGVLRRHG